MHVVTDLSIPLLARQLNCSVSVMLSQPHLLDTCQQHPKVILNLVTTAKVDHTLQITYGILCLHYLRCGTAVAQWLRCCATNRKMAGSTPASVNGISY